MSKRNKSAAKDSSTHLGFEAKLWLAAEVPQEASCSSLRGRVNLPFIGKDVDDATVAIERRRRSMRILLLESA